MHPKEYETRYIYIYIDGIKINYGIIRYKTKYFRK